MKITLNGEERDVAEGTTLAGLLEELGIDPRALAVERNREIAPRGSYATTPLAEGDRIEVVHFVGGG